MRLFKWLVEKYQPVKNRRDCKRGEHRWAEVVNKLEDGTKESWRVCQSCGETALIPQR